MFSGCRGTNAINTLLNLAYFKLSAREVSTTLGLQPSSLYNIHQGDDVWITNGSRIWAVALFRHMESCGFVFQASKQMFDTNRGEFLRVVYTQEGCRGYLARAIATTIVKPIQSTDINSPAERAVALNSQIAVLVRRGLSSTASTLLWNALIPYAATVDFEGKPIAIPISVLKKHHLDGGLDLGPPRTMAKRSAAISNVPILTLRSEELVRVVKKEMSTDYIRYISPRLNMVINSESWIDSLHMSNVSDSLRAEDKNKCLTELLTEMAKWKAKLVPGIVERDEETYKRGLSGRESLILFELDLKSLESAVGPKLSRKAKRQVANMHRCIASSPFKNLSDAMRATGLDGPEAALLAMSTCKVDNIRRPSMLLFTQLRDRCGDGVAVALLDGLRSGSTIFEGDFHPLILSWVQEYVLEDIATYALQKNLQDTYRLREAVNDRYLQYMRVIDKSETLRQISHY
uniref:RNA-directed RNA polymerase n=1 Tax=Emileo virus TaxID=2800915 RepID=A0A894KPC1_9VIRU|nr:MAG: RNA-dependent RNA polymerase [Emileo virus]